MKKIVNLLVDKRWYLLGGLITLTIAATLFLKNLGVENSLEVWFLKDDPTLINYNDSKKIYGTDEIISIWIKPETGIYEKSFIQKIYDLSEKLENNKLIHRVFSFTTAPYSDGKNNQLIVEKMMPLRPGDKYTPDYLKDRIKHNPLWKKLLVNKKSDAIIIIVEPIVDKKFDEKRPEIINFIKTNMEGFNYKLAGMGIIYDELNRISMTDASLFTSMAYLILIITLFIFFRKFSILIASTITIIISTMVFLGILGLTHHKFNMISIILPTLIIILCLADIIHIFSHYDKTSLEKDRLKRNLSYVFIPCLFTTVTTAVGFLSLVSSPMAILKNFGVFAAVGVTLAFFVSMIISSFILAYREKKDSSKLDSEESRQKLLKEDLFDKILKKINSLVQSQYKVITIVSSIIIIIGFVGFTQINVDTYSIDFLLDKNKMKQDAKFIESDYGNYFPFEIRLKPKSDNGVKDPVFLKKLVKLQEILDKDPELEKSNSLADIVRHLNRVLTDNKPESYKIPDTVNAVAQELLLYELDEDNDLSNFVDEDYTELRLITRIPMVSAKHMKNIKIKVESVITEIFGDEVEVILGGYLPLYVKLIEYVTQSQIKSFLIAMSVILLIMSLLFRSFSVILIGMVPNLLPIFLTLGVMGLTGINLDIATVTIAAIAISIAVDDTIHFIFMYKRKRSEGNSISDSISHTLQTSGKAIIITSFLLIIGYSVLLFASIKSVIFFGLLISITMFSALLCDLFLLPSLLLLFGKETSESA